MRTLHTIGASFSIMGLFLGLATNSYMFVALNAVCLVVNVYFAETAE